MPITPVSRLNDLPTCRQNIVLPHLAQYSHGRSFRSGVIVGWVTAVER